MTPERRAQLERLGAGLTPEEMAEGWHFCRERRHHPLRKGGDCLCPLPHKMDTAQLLHNKRLRESRGFYKRV